VSLAFAAGAGTGVSAPQRSTASISGAGATFPFPLISRWLPAYQRASGNTVTYNPIGSGGGISAITNRQVDFGASDAPLTPDQFTACKGCVQIPWVLSATSVAYNIPNVPVHLRITGQILAEIYLGNITNWNAPAIRRINPGVNLPDLKITPVFRSDGSGTTYNFTDYLSSVSPAFKSKVGTSTQVNFPAGVGGRGSSGVAGVVDRTAGALTYVDVAYSIQNHFKFFRVRNKAGKYQLPGYRGIVAAASTIKRVPASNEMHLVNPPKSNPLAYPICTFSYVILPLQSSKSADVRRFVNWALTTGQPMGRSLLFVPIPKVVKQKSQRTLQRVGG
jgi:phosphate transport system substrate-binding protein